MKDAWYQGCLLKERMYRMAGRRGQYIAEVAPSTDLVGNPADSGVSGYLSRSFRQF
ncbi:MAG: hypothetical protein ACOCWQ_05750 [Nanoarchaeota archaeon]